MLTLQFVPYYQIANLSSQKRLKKLLDLVKDNKIVMLEGRLRKEEETELIQRTMEEINDSFSGIELQVIDSKMQSEAFLKRLKNNITSMLLGDRQGMTIIGPASIIKEIKKDPDKIELLTQELDQKKKKKK